MESISKIIWPWLIIGWIGILLISPFVCWPAVPQLGTNITLAWNPSSGATGYNLYTNGYRVISVSATNGTVSNVPLQQPISYGVTAYNAVGESAATVLTFTVDTNNYVTNWILQPWYQTQYGPSLKGSNWANMGSPWRGQFTNLPSAFLRILFLSNQVMGFTVQTNPPPDTGAVQVLKSPIMLPTQ